MKIHKISENVGAEVTGVDLSMPVDAVIEKALKDTLADNIAMVVRDQKLTPENLYAVAQMFGEVMDQDHPKYSFPGLPHIKRHSNRNLDTAGNPVKEGSVWHTDGAFRLRPPKYTLLHAVELPDKGGNTSIANMCAAYKSLPTEKRQQLDTIRMACVRRGSRSKDPNYNNVAIMAAGGQVPNTHPLVRTIPETGNKTVWFNRNAVDFIEGMDPEQSYDFLTDLLDDLLKPEFIYSHTWKIGDLLMWDNRCSMHMVDFDYDANQHRLHYHAMTLGERPYGDALIAEAGK
jgi:taurine dioxygenase